MRVRRTDSWRLCSTALSVTLLAGMVLGSTEAQTQVSKPNLFCRFTHIYLEYLDMSVKPDLSGPHPVQSGRIYSYAIDWTYEDYVVRKGDRSLHPAPWDPRYNKMLIKDITDMNRFFDRLDKEFAVFDLTPGPQSEPAQDTYNDYYFRFKDSCGKESRLSYKISDDRHTDERYRRLIEAFEDFFEVHRVVNEKKSAP